MPLTLGKYRFKNSTFTSSEPGVQATSSLRGYLETSFQSLRVTG